MCFFHLGSKDFLLGNIEDNLAVRIDLSAYRETFPLEFRMRWRPMNAGEQVCSPARCLVETILPW